MEGMSRKETHMLKKISMIPLQMTYGISQFEHVHHQILVFSCIYVFNY